MNIRFSLFGISVLSILALIFFIIYLISSITNGNTENLPEILLILGGLIIVLIFCALSKQYLDKHEL